MPGFPYNLFPVSCGNIGFVNAWIKHWLGNQATKVSLLLLEPSCPLQAILLGNLVGFGNMLADCNCHLTCFILNLKGRGNEVDFLGFLHKSVPHESLTLPFEPFGF